MITEKAITICLLEILKECSFRVIANNAADLTNALVGGAQQPAGMVHTGYQQLLAEVHIIML